MVAVRWYLRYGLSYRDVEELLAERGIEVDHVSVYRWMQLFTPLLIGAARPCRHAPGDRWFVDEIARREARCDRAGVRGLRRLAVAAVGLKLRAV
jgi:transposase-like protein